MTRELTGLGTYLYTFSLNDTAEYEKAKTRLAKFGKVADVYIENKLALEVRMWRVVL